MSCTNRAQSHPLHRQFDMRTNPSRADHLRSAFEQAQSAHYAWRTSAAFVADRERALLQSAFLPLGARVLDLGCGEGVSLFHLGQPGGAWGVDLFPNKLRFAQRQLPSCRFACASVYELPFAAGAFDHLLVRDLIHHLDEPARFIDECERVLVPGGRIDVLEPCRYNPLIAAHALALRVERGELGSTMPFLRRLLRPHFDIERTATLQAMPLHRLVFHPDLGRPAWGEKPLLRRAVELLESAAHALVPRWARAYMHVRAIKREQ